MQDEKIRQIGINAEMYGIHAPTLQHRMLAAATSPEEATRICERCGVVSPIVLRYGPERRYAPGWCHCKQRAREKQEADARRQMKLDAAARVTYTWMGVKYSSLALRSCTFENFDREKQPDGFDIASAFAMLPEGTLVLHGDYGTGKTHLLAAICNAVLQKKSMHSRFTTSPILFRAIQDCIADKKVDNTSYDGFIRQAINTPLLVLDDIDKAKWTEFREEIYFEIVDERVKAGRPIAISTNKLDDLSQYVGGAVCSRLKVGQIDAEMIGEDQRPFYDAKR